jgi:hypothetical protein
MSYPDDSPQCPHEHTMDMFLMRLTPHNYCPSRPEPLSAATFSCRRTSCCTRSAAFCCACITSSALGGIRTMSWLRTHRRCLRRSPPEAPGRCKGFGNNSRAHEEAAEAGKSPWQLTPRLLLSQLTPRVRPSMLTPRMGLSQLTPRLGLATRTRGLVLRGDLETRLRCRRRRRRQRDGERWPELEASSG